jgi:hypothetical protein
MTSGCLVRQTAGGSWPARRTRCAARSCTWTPCRLLAIGNVRDWDSGRSGRCGRGRHVRQRRQSYPRRPARRRRLYYSRPGGCNGVARRPYWLQETSVLYATGPHRTLWAGDRAAWGTLGFFGPRAVLHESWTPAGPSFGSASSGRGPRPVPLPAPAAAFDRGMT